MKDLFDAVKEAYSQSEPSPAEGGWQKVSTSMRRASALRTIAWGGASIAACAAVALLFARVPDGNADVAPAPYVASELPVTEEPDFESLQSVEDAYAPSASIDAGSAPLVAQVWTDDAVSVGKEVPSSDDFVAAQIAVATSSSEGTSNVVHNDASDAVDARQTERNNAQDSNSIRTDDSENQETALEKWWEEEPVPQKKHRVRIGLNASTSPVSSAASNVFIPQMDFLAKLKSNNFLNHYTYSEINSFLGNFSSVPTVVSYSHDLPVGLGIAFNFPLAERFSIETGLNYTYLHSVEDNNGSLSDQNLHFAGIPLRASYAIIRRGDFSLYAGAGASLEKCLKASIGRRSYDEKRLQWSGEAFAGAEYRLWKSTSIYFQPTLSYWFTDTDLITYRTENPLVFSLSAGLRFHL